MPESVPVPSSTTSVSSVTPSGAAPSRRSVLAAAGLVPWLATPGSHPDPECHDLASRRHSGARTFSAPADAAGKGYSIAYVSFDDLAPSYLTLTESWNALGMDDQDRVYVIWTSTRDDGRGDSALFRYTHATGEREFLGTFIDVATRQQNLRPGEQIPKGHTRILQVGRKMFMASQGFHDFKAEIDTLPDYRGAHLFTYDLDTGAFDDASRSLPGGVLVEHQGIVALNYSPELGLLAGLAHPLGDIVLVDPATAAVRKVVPGIPWQLNHMVSREIVVTRTGKIYTYRGPEDPSMRDMTNEVWVYDLAADTMKPTGQVLRGGFWNGQAQTRNRDRVYLSTVSGELYVLDVRRGSFTHLGHFTDRADYTSDQQYRVMYFYGISLDASEDTLVGLPVIAPTAGDGDSATRLTTYRISRQRFTKQLDTDIQVFTGSNHRDRKGNLYLAAFDWDHNCHLAILSPR